MYMYSTKTLRMNKIVQDLKEILQDLSCISYSLVILIQHIFWKQRLGVPGYSKFVFPVQAVRYYTYHVRQMET